MNLIKELRADLQHLEVALELVLLAAAAEFRQERLHRGRWATTPFHLEAAHPIKLHELGRALKNQPRALDVLNARYQPLDVVIIEEQRPDERVGSGEGCRYVLLAALNISVRKHRDLDVCCDGLRTLLVQRAVESSRSR